MCGCVSYHPRFFFLCVGGIVGWYQLESILFLLLFVMKSILLPLFVVSLVVCFLILILFSKGGVACLWCLYVCVCVVFAYSGFCICSTAVITSFSSCFLYLLVLIQIACFFFKFS